MKAFAYSMADINPRATEHAAIRAAVRAACAPFDSAYWQGVERAGAYPEAFVQALTRAGWLAALIPEEYGGGGLSLTEASVILDGMNAERILIAAECIGDGFWFIDRARRYASERTVFDRPIGQNQGIQFPIARAYANVRAAHLMRYEAARLFDDGHPCGAEANMAKLLAADASWEAANCCLQTHGGFGFAVEFDIERKFRETRLYQVAPVSTNLILSYLGEHVLEMPRSF